VTVGGGVTAGLVSVGVRSERASDLSAPRT